MEKVKKTAKKVKTAVSKKADLQKVSEILSGLNDANLVERLAEVENVLMEVKGIANKSIKQPSQISKVLFTILFAISISIGAIFGTGEDKTQTPNNATIVVGSDTLSYQEAMNLLNTLNDLTNAQ